MALVLKDRVLESSTSTGTGSFTLTGAQTGYQSFSAIGNGNTTYYTIQGKNLDGTLTGEWEVGIGTWSTGNTLSRDTVLSNSLDTTANIVFSAGAKDVFCDYPASKSVNQNADNKVLIPYTSGVTNVGSLNVGDATAHTDSGVIAAFTASEPLYLYTSLQNTSSANTSYASYAVNDGGHTSYGELGINNSNYSYTAAGFPNNTFSAPLATFVESYGGPLAIGTWDSQKISFIVNGSVNTTDAMTISAAGVVSLGTALGVTSGGTGLNSYTTGDILYSSATNTLNKLGIGSTGQVLTVAGGVPTWAAGGGGLTINTTTISGGTSGRVLYDNAGTVGELATTGTSNVVLSDSPTITGTVLIGSTSGTAAVTLGRSGTALAVVNINTGASGGKTTNIATNASSGTNTVSIGSTVGSSNVINIATGTNNQTLNIANGTATGTKTIDIGGGGASVTNLFLANTGSGSASVVIGGSTDNTITIANSGGVSNAQAITIGSTVGSSTTTVNGILKQQTYTVATLPSASTSGVGARSFVTNALAPTFGATVVTGGAVAVPVYSDGTNWKVG